MQIQKIINNNKETFQKLLNIGFKIAGNSLVRLSKSSRINIITIYNEYKFVISLSESVLDNGIEYNNLKDVLKYFETFRSIYHSKEELDTLVNTYKYIDEYYGMDVFVISNEHQFHICKLSNGHLVFWAVCKIYGNEIIENIGFQNFERLCYYLDFIDFKD